MELSVSQSDKQQKLCTQSTVSKSSTDELISLKECKQFVGEFELPDQHIIEIRNNMIGIVDQVISKYLKNFG